jgi:hypothetical protein
MLELAIPPFTCIIDNDLQDLVKIGNLTETESCGGFLNETDNMRELNCVVSTMSGFSKLIPTTKVSESSTSSRLSHRAAS